MKTELYTPQAVDVLLPLLNKVTFNTLRSLEYQGIPFLFFRCDTLEESDGYSPATYHQSTLTDGFDIYVWEGVSEEELPRLLFHELFECFLRMRGYSNEEAHSFALAEEEKVFGLREVVAV